MYKKHFKNHEPIGNTRSVIMSICDDSMVEGNRAGVNYNGPLVRH